MQEWDSHEEWAPYLAALGWRGTPDVLEALRPLAAGADPRARSVAAYVAGQLGAARRTLPEESATLLEEMAGRERDPGVLAVIAEAFGHLGEPWGTERLLGLRRHADGAVRDAVASALAGRGDPRATAALIELSADADARVRDWATFALGTLAAEDSAALRDALAARLDDADAETRIEAVHGLALRGDLRAVEPALAILAAGEPGGSRWTRHALSESAIRLAALTGDPRFAPYLPPLDGVWAGTALQRELARAHERCAGGG